MARLPARLRSLRADTRSPRRTIFEPMRTLPAPPPSAFAAFGDGAWLVPPLRARGAARTTIGSGTVILEHLDLAVAPGGRVAIGPRVRLGRFATITCAHSVVLGADVSGSDGVSITDCWGPLEAEVDDIPPPPGAPVVVEDGAYLGANSTIGPGVTIGRGAFVGEGSVVLDDVPSFSVVYGNPAVIVRRHAPATGWQGERFG